MKKETVETLSELYAIRAVMSYVSQNNDEVNNIVNNEIDDRNKRIKKLRKDNQRLEETIDSEYRYDIERKKYETQISDLEVENNDLLSRISSLRKSIKKNSGGKIGALIGYFFLGILVTMIPVGIALTLVFYILNYYIMSNSSGADVLMIITTVVWAIASIIYAIIKSEIFGTGRKGYKALIHSLKELVKNNRDNIAGLKKLINSVDRLIKEYGIYKPGADELKRQTEENNRVIEQLQGEINDCLDRVKQIKEKSVVLVSVAMKVYPTVNTGLWIYIDLLIDGIESGRADSLKKAVNIIEAERRNQSIEIAMGNATERLAQIISSSLATPGCEPERSFDRLITVLNRYNRSGKIELEEVVMKSDDSSGQDGETYRYGQCNYTVQEMTKALLDKIGTSSDRLVADIQSQLKGQKLIG